MGRALLGPEPDSDFLPSEAASRDSEERFRQIAEGVDAIFYVTDLPARQVLYVSPAYQRLWGLDPAELYRDQTAWLRYIHPDDLQQTAAAHAAFLAGGPAYDVEYRIVLPDGAVRWVRDRATVAARGAGGAVARVTGIAEDVTERKETERALRESEARFRNMADHAPVMVWVTDGAAVCTYLSKSWYEFTGQTPETGLGFGWLDAVHPDDRGRSGEVFAAAHSRRAPFRLDYRLRQRDGGYHWAIDSATPRFGPGGEFLGYIGSVLDITERKGMEMALQEADRRKDEFLAMLAHELRNPLAPIRNATQVLKLDGPANARQARMLEVIERQTEHLTHLVDDLLDVSRITRGIVILRREPVDLADVLHRAVEAWRPLIEERRHRLTLELPPEPVRVEGDPTRLVQVAANLLHNAAKYTDPGGEIRLAVARDGGEAVVRVCDNGMGLAPDLLPHVFDLFTQADRALDRSQGGLGIGLTVVQRLVGMHGGRVEAKSAGPGQGSEFVLRLPTLPPGTAEGPPAGEPARA